MTLNLRTLLTAEHLDPTARCWVILDKKTGQPLGAYVPGGALAMMAWSSKELAEQWRRQDKNARRGRLLPWTLSQIATWCKTNKVAAILPDVIQRHVRVTVEIDVASLDAVLTRDAAPGN